MQTLSEISVKGLVPVGLLFLCGVILWAAGRRVMRVGFAATGLLVGGVLGAVLGEGGDLGVEPWIAGVCGAVAFAIVAALAYRLALAAAVGLLLATLVPMGVWTAEHEGLIVFKSHDTGGEGDATQPVLATDPPGTAPALSAPGTGATPGATPEGDAAKPKEPLTVPGEVEHGLSNLGDLADRIIKPSEVPPPAEGHPAVGGGDTASTATDPAGDDRVAAHLATPLKAAVNVVRRAWRDAEAPMRGSFVAAGLFGAMLGLVIGTAAPMFSAILVSALGGSFLVLSSGWIIGARIGKNDWMPQTPTAWTILWLLTALVGLAIQWIFRPRRKSTVAE